MTSYERKISSTSHSSGTYRASSLRQSSYSSPTATPSTPHQRVGSTYSVGSTTSSSYRTSSDEDAVIIELGTRYLRAGYEGDYAPQCCIDFGPEQARRVGDYRGWTNHAQLQRGGNPKEVTYDEWGRNHEFWQMDLRNADLGVIEDKLERAIREAYNKYLLSDAGTTRLVLVVPSLLPHPLLSSILSFLFHRWRYPLITLLPAPTMTAAAAGVRAALVVDVGWSETTVSGIYEYREIGARRSSRAMKMLTWEMGKLLTEVKRKRKKQKSANTKKGKDEESEVTVDFEFSEEVVNRVAWCKPVAATSSLDSKMDTLSIVDEDDEDDFKDAEEHPDPEHRKIRIPFPSSSATPRQFRIPFSDFARPVEAAFFAPELTSHDIDDDDEPLHILVYRALLNLPSDVRASSMSRIIFTGGGSNIPGLKERILSEVQSIISKYGWDPVRGRIIDKKHAERNGSPNKATTSDPESPTASPDPTSPTPDPIEILMARKAALLSSSQPSTTGPVTGILREITSMGPWTGASLVAGLKIRGLTEIERERYIAHGGLASASRDGEGGGSVGSGHGHGQKGASGRGAGAGGKGEDRGAWSLGGWA